MLGALGKGLGAVVRPLLGRALVPLGGLLVRGLAGALVGAVGGVPAAIAVSIAGLGALVYSMLGEKQKKVVREQLADLWKGIKNFFMNFGDYWKKFTGWVARLNIVKTLKGAYQAVKTGVQWLADPLFFGRAKAMGYAKDAVKKGFKGAVDNVKGFFGKMGEKIATPANFAKDAMDRAGRRVHGFFEDVGKTWRP